MCSHPGLPWNSQRLRFCRCPNFTVHLGDTVDTSGDQESPGQTEVTSGRHVAPLLLLLHRHTHPGHPLVTSGTLRPADDCYRECPETQASGILRFKVGKRIKTRAMQSAVFCAINFLVYTCPNKNQRYKTEGNISLLIVTAMCYAWKGLDPILPFQGTFKNFRSEVFLLPMWGSKIKIKKQNRKIN